MNDESKNELETEEKNNKQEKNLEILDRELPELIEDIRNLAENNIKYVNLIQENARNQNDNMNYLEKKIEYIEKTLELKTKHFDEVLKGYMENNSELAKMVRANLHEEGNTITYIEKNINFLKYWFLITIIVISAVMWGVSTHLYGKNTAANLVTSDIIQKEKEVIPQVDTKKIISNLSEENKVIVSAILKETRVVSDEQRKSSQEQINQIIEENKKFLKSIQNENKEFITAIQQSNQEQLTTVIKKLRATEKTKPTIKESSVSKKKGKTEEVVTPAEEEAEPTDEQ